MVEVEVACESWMSTLVEVEEEESKFHREW